jgi:hypothetical protein
MGSNPIIGTLENAVLRGKIVRTHRLGGRERSRTETHENTAYLSTIRQLANSEILNVIGCRITGQEQNA